MNILTIHTDGGARGNPGPSAVGVAFDSADFHLEHERTIGTATNNVAEYMAVVDAFEKLPAIIAEQGITNVAFFLDSELVVKQIRKEYKVKEPTLQELNRSIQEQIKNLKIPCTFTHVRRAENKLADSLVNHALDAL